MVEDVEGLVVADDLCSSTKYFWYQTEPNADPLDAIVKFNMNRCVCCTMFPAEKRYDFLKELIDEFDVEGVIYFNLKYCHPCVYESFTFKNKLEEDIPVLILEAEHSLSGMGQLRTRVQAFIEMLQISKIHQFFFFDLKKGIFIISFEEQNGNNSKIPRSGE